MKSFCAFVGKNFFVNLCIIVVSNLFPWASFGFVVLFYLFYFLFQGIPGFTGNIGVRGYPGRQVR